MNSTTMAPLTLTLTLMAALAAPAAWAQQQGGMPPLLRDNAAAAPAAAAKDRAKDAAKAPAAPNMPAPAAGIDQEALVGRYGKIVGLP